MRPPNRLQNSSSPPPAERSPSPITPNRVVAAIVLLASLVYGCIWLVGIASRTPASGNGQPSAQADGASALPASYIGTNACKKCHEQQFKDWTGSHHEQAMQHATPGTVLGDFKDATFSKDGVTTRFFIRDGKFMVNTDGPDGKPTDYTIEYTFGVYPLQQYLVAFSGGRYQALPIAWDSRPKTSTGPRGEKVEGQKWFHLYPNEKIDHTDQLHWTGRYQNWNMMCAECHSTNLRKGYDAATNAYKTTFNEINVACEQCHGPGSKHADWTRRAKPPYDKGGDHGFDVKLDSQWPSAWRFEKPDAHFPVRDTPASAATLNTCAQCHARRSTLAEGWSAGGDLAQTHRLSMLTDPLYYNDGQQRDEVYVWGSFLQSRMYKSGVTCMDCHDAHSLKTRAPGNDLCARCHQPAMFNTPAHHFHKEGSTGASCTNCHMPTQKYMVVHERLDHSIRVPRPDVSAASGSPDACTQCHTDRSPDWAAKAMDGWYTPKWRQRQQWGATVTQAVNQAARGVPTLMALAQESTYPSIVRATAATIVSGDIGGSAGADGGRMDPQFLSVAAGMIADADPSVRIAGLGLLDGFAVSVRKSLATASLADPVRGVRIQAARLLADVPTASLQPASAKQMEKALSELESALKLNADWPAENLNAGSLALRRGRTDDAIAAFTRANTLDPRFVGGYINLADTYRQVGRDPEGEAVLRKGLAAVPAPGNADLHHALGLLLVRKGAAEMPTALLELKSAAELAPANTRYAYVYAVALHSTGKTPEALSVLRETDKRHPYDPDVLMALVSILQERGQPGDKAEALAYARRLGEAFPNDASIAQLIKDLSAKP